jgi:chorismate mutase / prephenate dehydratase
LPTALMEKPITRPSLKEIRSEIDAIDRALLELLEKRFAAIASIKRWKEERGSEASSPIRPAREAEILRRLERLRGEAVPPELMVRLWRGIMAAATAAQAEVTIHVSGDIGSDAGLRDLVREHFAGLTFKEHDGIERAIRASAAKPADITAVRTESDWVAAAVKQKPLKVIGMLPLLAKPRAAPRLLMLGQVKAEPTGQDQTLIALPPGGKVPAEALWSAAAGDFRCIALNGFLDERSPILQGANHATILGQCPAPLEVHR